VILGSLQRGLGGDDKGFYGRDGILVLGSDRPWRKQSDSFACTIGERP
jgi:hypothetical protein